MIYVISNRINGCNLALQCQLAHSYWERMRGLLGAPPLQPGQALWLEHCKSVHTFGMTYAIDVVFVDHNLLILKQIYSMKPCRMSGVVWNASATIELPPGTLKKTGTLPGHQLSIDARNLGKAP